MSKLPPELILVAKDHNLQVWNRDWELDGDLLICCHCHVTQPIHHASRLFTHMPPCTAEERPPHHPWQELADIIKGMLKNGNT